MRYSKVPVHDLVFLLEQIDKVDNLEEMWFDKVLELQDYAVEIRYPDYLIDLSDDDIVASIEIAQDFRRWILKESI